MNSIRDLLVSADKESIVIQKDKNITTLEAHHNLQMSTFMDEKNTLEQLEQQLEEYEVLMNNIPESSVFSDEWRQYSDTTDELRKQIKSIKTDDRRLDYFLDAGNLLFQYFDAKNTIANGSAFQTIGKYNRMPVNSVLNYFKVDAVKPEPTKPSRICASSIDSTDGLNRDKLLDRYLSIVNPTAIKNGIMPGSGIEDGWGLCPSCNAEMSFYQNEAKLGCSVCGHEEFVLIDSEKPSYKDPPREITYFAYKKSNHFNEWLAQFQAKETTDISQGIIDNIMKELRKERISDPRKVKKEKIRDILHKLKLTKMYDHIQQIRSRIMQQMTMLTLSKEMEEKLQHMFKEIQPAFIKYCPSTRSNFLSYPYVLYKLCQLLDMDEFLPCFQLLKSREKLYLQDKVWQKICTEMRWEFIPSI